MSAPNLVLVNTPKAEARKAGAGRQWLVQVRIGVVGDSPKRGWSVLVQENAGGKLVASVVAGERFTTPQHAMRVSAWAIDQVRLMDAADAANPQSEEQDT